MRAQALVELRADSSQRVQRRHRILEYVCDAGAAQLRHALARRGHDAFPQNRTSPLSTRPEAPNKPATARSTDDLPEPLSPTRPTISPGRTSKEAAHGPGHLHRRYPGCVRAIPECRDYLTSVSTVMSSIHSAQPRNRLPCRKRYRKSQELPKKINALSSSTFCEICLIRASRSLSSNAAFKASISLSTSALGICRNCPSPSRQSTCWRNSQHRR